MLKNSIKNFLIIGDFNVNEFSVTDYTLFRNPISTTLVNFYIDYLNLKQVNNITNSHNGILDLIFSNSTFDSMHASNCSLIPLIDSYHPPLEFISHFPIPNIYFQTISPVIFNFNSCNFNDILAFLSHIDIMDNITTLNLENAILKFHEIINHSFDLLVPMITLDLNTDHNVSWSNYNLRKIIKLKKLAHKK